MQKASAKKSPPSIDVLEFGLNLLAARRGLERAARLRTGDPSLQLRLVEGALQAAWRARHSLSSRLDLDRWLAANLRQATLH
jgi:hypothetical protein